MLEALADLSSALLKKNLVVVSDQPTSLVPGPMLDFEAEF